MSSTQSSNDLEQGLKPRHVTMLSIAGVIGAGLLPPARPYCWPMPLRVRWWSW
jgi:hypothetical protein